MMVCRRNEIQLYDPVEGMRLSPFRRPRATAQSEFRGIWAVARAGIRLSMDSDDAHRNTPWRVWRVGCPSPIVDTRTGTVIGYKLPECGHRDTVICEVDSVI